MLTKGVCLALNCVIQSMAKNIKALSLENKKFKSNQILSKKVIYIYHLAAWQRIKTNEKMNFYTGISSIDIFLTVFKLIELYLPKVKYWVGTKRITSKKIRTFRRSKFKKLSYKDEFLLTLMRLRLGLLNEDLADRFCISKTVCSNTFKTWIRLLIILLGDSLIKWLPVEYIRENLPKVYQSAGHHKLRCIIDCSEIFIERPKALDLQAQT